MCLSLREYLIVPTPILGGKNSIFQLQTFITFLLRSHSISFSLGEEVDDVTMDGRKVGRASDFQPQAIVEIFLSVLIKLRIASAENATQVTSLFSLGGEDLLLEKQRSREGGPTTILTR